MNIDDAITLAMSVATPLLVAGLIWLAKRSAKGRNAELIDLVRSDLANQLEGSMAEQTRQHSEMRELVKSNHSDVSTRIAQVERDLGQTRADVAYLRGRSERGDPNGKL